MANHIGKTLWVAQAHPATNDTAGFEALTWVQVNGLQVLPTLGGSHNLIDVEDLAVGEVTAEKGAHSGNDSTMSFYTVAADAGQIDIKEQADDDAGALSVRIVTGSGTDSGSGPAPVTGDPVVYAQGIAHSYVDNEGNVSNHDGFQVGFRQNLKKVTGTVPA